MKASLYRYSLTHQLTILIAEFVQCAVLLIPAAVVAECAVLLMNAVAVVEDAVVHITAVVRNVKLILYLLCKSTIMVLFY